MTSRPLIATLPLLLVAACDFNVLVVEVESDEVCVIGLTADIPANVEGSVTVTLTREDRPEDQEGEGAFDIDVPEGWEVTELTLRGVAVRPEEGVSDLQFIDTVYLDMTAVDPDLDLPTVTLLDVDLTDHLYNSSAGGSKFLESPNPINLVDYLSADELQFGLDLTGDMPAQEWVFGMDVCFTFVAEYRENL